MPLHGRQVQPKPTTTPAHETERGTTTPAHDIEQGRTEEEALQAEPNFGL